jgi:hypothetical protein
MIASPSTSSASRTPSDDAAFPAQQWVDAGQHLPERIPAHRSGLEPLLFGPNKRSPVAKGGASLQITSISSEKQESGARSDLRVEVLCSSLRKLIVRKNFTGLLEPLRANNFATSVTTTLRAQGRFLPFRLFFESPMSCRLGTDGCHASSAYLRKAKAFPALFIARFGSSDCSSYATSLSCSSRVMRRGMVVSQLR